MREHRLRGSAAENEQSFASTKRKGAGKKQGARGRHAREETRRAKRKAKAAERAELERQAREGGDAA